MENNIVPSSDSAITPSLSDSAGVIPVASPEGDNNIDPNSIIRLVPVGFQFNSVKEWVMNIYHIIFKQPYNYMINNEAFTVTFDGFEFSAFILGSTVLGSLIGGLVASIL
ncbi:unnamed protein product [[Candida] boidinii]|uniref:Unnamed protein product n=1 Tax=Candida boidinii TaxID=5477 RepID=A0A9W6WL80_CANBO|nr:unnamed protein product [[Candida] boidinii]